MATLTNNNNNNNEQFRIGYVTDVEGNLDFFQQYVELSNVLKYSNSTKNKLILKDGCYFVHGGDIVDKGNGDIRLCRQLVDLKKRYPKRVFLLVGNRDLNKFRFSAELSEDDIARDVTSIPGPHWDPKAPTIYEYLNEMAKELNIKNVNELNTKVNRLKYMLKHTLGCPSTFEFRREELSIMQKQSIENITDEDVLKSFIYEITNEEGSLFQYIRNGTVAARIGNTLFVHGTIDKINMKYVPQHIKFENAKSPQKPAQIVEDLDEWINELNKYLQEGILDFKRRPNWDQARSTRGGESLMALQNRSASWGRSVIVNCYGDGGNISSESALAYLNDEDRIKRSKGDPLAFEGVSSDPRDKEVSNWLLKYNIQRVLVGHKPCGDSPAVCNSSYTGVEICCSDTSFSYFGNRESFSNTADVKQGTPPRGCAVSSTEVVGNSKTDNRLILHGRFQDGVEYKCEFNRLYDKNCTDKSIGDSLLGKEIKDGWWVKASYDTKNGTIYHCSTGNGRNVKYKRCTRKEIEQSML